MRGSEKREEADCEQQKSRYARVFGRGDVKFFICLLSALWI